MPDSTAAVPAPAVKPGWQTTEFWLHLGIQAALAKAFFTVLGALSIALPQAGLPLLVTGAVAVAIPIVQGWLVKAYGDNRTDTKTAFLERVSSAGIAGASADTAAVVNGG